MQAAAMAGGTKKRVVLEDRFAQPVDLVGLQMNRSRFKDGPPSAFLNLSKDTRNWRMKTRESIETNWRQTIEDAIPPELKPRKKSKVGQSSQALPWWLWPYNLFEQLHELSRTTMSKLDLIWYEMRNQVNERRKDPANANHEVQEIVASDVERILDKLNEPETSTPQQRHQASASAVPTDEEDISVPTDYPHDLMGDDHLRPQSVEPSWPTDRAKQSTSFEVPAALMRDSMSNTGEALHTPSQRPSTTDDKESPLTPMQSRGAKPKKKLGGFFVKGATSAESPTLSVEQSGRPAPYTYIASTGIQDEGGDVVETPRNAIAGMSPMTMKQPDLLAGNTDSTPSFASVDENYVDHRISYAERRLRNAMRSSTIVLDNEVPQAEQSRATLDGRITNARERDQVLKPGVDMQKSREDMPRFGNDSTSKRPASVSPGATRFSSGGGFAKRLKDMDTSEQIAQLRAKAKRKQADAAALQWEAADIEARAAQLEAEDRV